MKYSTVTEEQLNILQQGLDLMGHVSLDLVPTTLYLYGLLKPDSPVLQAVSEAAWEANYAGEVRAEELHVQVAAVSIRISGDVLRAVLGSGLKSDDDEFIYSLNGESHSSSFSYTDGKPTLQLSQFSEMALADDSFWLKDFFQAVAPIEQQQPSVVTRTGPAVGQHGGAEERLHEQHPHQSSLKPRWNDDQVRDIIERMLG